MRSFKQYIGSSWVIMAYNQLVSYVKARNHIGGLDLPPVEDFSAKALFGNNGDESSVFSADEIKPRLEELSNRVSERIFIVNRGKSSPLPPEDVVDSPDELVMDHYGFRDLFKECLPHLL